MLLQEKYPPKPRQKSVTYENIINDKTNSNVVAFTTKGVIEVKVLGSEENLLLILEKTKKFYTYSTFRI